MSATVIEKPKLRYLIGLRPVFGSVVAILFLFHSSHAAFSMDESELIKFARTNQITGSEPVVYKWDEEPCGPSEAVLVKTFDNGQKIGAITYQGLCWGAVYSYFEMTKGALGSIKLISAISSGRSEHFSNWSASSTAEVMPTKKQLKAIAEKISH